jgi:hypothetical protein
MQQKRWHRKRHQNRRVYLNENEGSRRVRVVARKLIISLSVVPGRNKASNRANPIHRTGLLYTHAVCPWILADPSTRRRTTGLSLMAESTWWVFE